jgi:signal transduction histidine kinase/AmiR/NasT family two-component response regulator
MSTLANMQDDPVTRQIGARLVIDPPPLAGDLHEGSPADVAEPPASSSRLQGQWLNGGGLVGGATMLAVGYAGGALALAALLGIIALAITAAGLARARRARLAPLAVPSAVATDAMEQDRPWERDEHVGSLYAIHDAIGDMALTRGIDRRILDANATFCRLTGRLNPAGLTLEDAGLVFSAATAPGRQDAVIATPEGARVFAWQDVMLRDTSTGRLLIHSIGRDVTGERHAAHLADEARQKAEYNSAAKSRLLATVSHEIRTPLSGILGMNHLLAQTPLTPEQANYSTGIGQSGQALVQLVEGLLDFSTIEVGRFELRPRREDLRRLLEGVVEMLAHRAHEKDIEIAATFDAGIPDALEFDPARLRQVLFNVIGNAVKFTQAGGILIRTRLIGDDLAISVEDSGPGMAQEEQARIFGEFEQAGNMGERSAGTGLGLAIAARIVREFGGSLNVESEKGRGSTFLIRFPVNADRQDGRRDLLGASGVLLLAPEGPVSAAIMETVHTLGGRCTPIRPDGAEAFMRTMEDGRQPTDLIVDHRLADWFLQQDRELVSGLRKILLVNPEERNIHPLDRFDAWLIRPLREQSLIDVLSGRLRGIAKHAVSAGADVPEDMLPLASAGPALSVLVGEDDAVNAMLVRAMLTKAGHRVQLVDSFEGLFDRALSGSARPDIVITDLSMPGGDGLQILARLRAAERRSSRSPVPVIVLTADSRENTRRQALLAGADVVIVKPVAPDHLLHHVDRLSSQAIDESQRVSAASRRGSRS